VDSEDRALVGWTFRLGRDASGADRARLQAPKALLRPRLENTRHRFQSQPYLFTALTRLPAAAASAIQHSVLVRRSRFWHKSLVHRRWRGASREDLLAELEGLECEKERQRAELERERDRFRRDSDWLRKKVKDLEQKLAARERARFRQAAPSSRGVVAAARLHCE